MAELPGKHHDLSAMVTFMGDKVGKEMHNVRRKAGDLSVSSKAEFRFYQSEV